MRRRKPWSWCTPDRAREPIRRRGLDPDVAHAVTSDGEGHVILAGVTSATNANFAVVRLLDDGTPDTSFSATGAIVVDFAGSTDVAENVAVTAAGDVVVGGLARNLVDGYGVVRLTRRQTDAGATP